MSEGIAYAALIESARVEVLKRLAKFNKERWEEEEAARLHKKGKK